MADYAVGKQVLARLMVDPEGPAKFLQLQLHGEQFYGTEADLFAQCSTHMEKYGALPKPETVGIELPATIEPLEYYVDQLRERHLYRSTAALLEAASEHLRGDSRDARKALDTIQDGLAGMLTQRHSGRVIDFTKDAVEILRREYVLKLKLGTDYGVLTGWPYLDEMLTGGLQAGDVMAIVGRPAAGKALAHGTPVLLSDGTTKPIEDVKVGDYVASVDGAESQVYGVYRQGVRGLFRVTLGDGRHLDVDGEHLWKVGCKYWDGSRVMTTHDLVHFREKAKRYRDTLWVPTFEGEYGGATVPLIDPYLLGALLGDGGLTQGVTVTNIDGEVVRRIEDALPSSYCLVPYKKQQGRVQSYAIASVGMSRPRNEVKAALVEYGVWGNKSEHKELPESVFAWTRENRVALLQGLMDTDGTVDDKGAVTFGSSSKALADGVVRLVRSLGGKAKLRAPKKTAGLDHWRCSVMLSDRSEAFSLGRKKERCRPYATHNPKHLRIVSVEPLGAGEATCIAVTHPSRLFVAGEYVVTHNTYNTLYMANNAWHVHKRTVMFVSMEIKPTPLLQRIAAMHTHRSITELRAAKMATKAKNSMFTELSLLPDTHPPYWVVDGNLAATPQDIVMLARQLRPSVVYVDGAYLLRSPNPRLSKWERIGSNLELLKQVVAGDMGIPVVASYQFNRDAAKKKRQTTGLEDIAGADAIGQIASVVLGLFEDETVETLNRKSIEVLKGRNGEVGEFKINWKFDEWPFMDFSQVEEEDDGELVYL